MQTGLQKLATVEPAMIRVKYLLRNWSSRYLAFHCGISHRTLQSEFSRGFTSKRCQWRIEKALACAIFRSPAEFNRRLALLKCLEEDPFFVRFHDLAKEAARLHVAGWGKCKSKEKLIDAFYRHFGIGEGSPESGAIVEPKS